MLTIARYICLLPPSPELWIEAESFSSSTGDVRKPDSESSNISPRKALPGSRLLEINTCEANATNSLALYTFLDFVDWNRRRYPCCPVSRTKTMGLDGYWMSESSVLYTDSEGSLAEESNTGSTLSHLRKPKHIDRYYHHHSTGRDLVERSDQGESEKGHLFSLRYTDSVREASIVKKQILSQGFTQCLHRMCAGARQSQGVFRQSGQALCVENSKC